MIIVNYLFQIKGKTKNDRYTYQNLFRLWEKKIREIIRQVIVLIYLVLFPLKTE